MTTYSVHPARGRTQILATFPHGGSVISETVTSVQDPEVARRVVNALNAATQAVWALTNTAEAEWLVDLADEAMDLARAAMDPGLRPELTTGVRSLAIDWLAWHLHVGLDELADALRGQPGVISSAVEFDLAQSALAMIDPDDGSTNRPYDGSVFHHGPWSNSPFAPSVLRDISTFESPLRASEVAVMVHAMREMFRLQRAIGAERCMVDVWDEKAGFCLESEDIWVNDHDAEHSFNLMLVPRHIPPLREGDMWSFDIREMRDGWGQEIASCEVPPERLDDVAEAFKMVDQELVQEWAVTEVGDRLAGTQLVVSSRTPWKRL